MTFQVRYQESISKKPVPEPKQLRTNPSIILIDLCSCANIFYSRHPIKIALEHYLHHLRFTWHNVKNTFERRQGQTWSGRASVAEKRGQWQVQVLYSPLE